MPEFASDIIIYGGTSAALIAAVQARRMGKSVIVVSPDRHLGGMTSSGLGFTDSGNTAAVGGLARQFYSRLYEYYRSPAHWKWQRFSEFSNQGQETPAIDHQSKTCWCFEPGAAESVFEQLVSEYEIPVQRDEWLDRDDGVVVADGRIIQFRTLSGNAYQGQVFLDASYEGDLMAAVGVSYHVGREANAQYGETWNGVQTGTLHHKHWFMQDVSPYAIAGDSNSGLLPYVSPEPPGHYGESDRKIQAYCFRLCLSNHPENRIPFPKPDGYDPAEFELFLRAWDGRDDFFEKFDRIPNCKSDTNNHGPFSSDHIGMSWDYPEASYQHRRAIIAEHERYQKSLMYFAQNDPRVPSYIHDGMQQWGLPKDEFMENSGWPYQLYIREARRMIGKALMTEHEIMGRREVQDPVGMGSYNLDSHNVQRYIKPDGFVQNEGDIGIRPPRPYGISYDCLVPKAGEIQNILVPVCLSSSHIAYGSIRMEPVFMVLGQSAATAAVLAIENDCPVQELDYPELRARLVEDQQVLEL